MSSRYASELTPSLASIGPRPQVMTGAFVQWLRQHFAAASNLEDTDLAKTNTSYVWSSSLDLRKLVIESYTMFDPSLVEFRPAIVVKRGPWKHQRLGIDNRLMGRPSADGSHVYCNLWVGSHTLFCIAGEGAECEKLTAEVYREINEFAPIMRQALCLTRLEMMEVGELSILEESTENFVVPVTVGYAFQETWTVRPVAARPFQKMDLSVITP